MQPATNSARSGEDLHAILSRFQTWAGKQPETRNGHNHSAAGVREIPMEEALRQLRSGRATAKAAAREKPPAPQPPVVPVVREAKVEIAPKPVPEAQMVAPAPRAHQDPMAVADTRPGPKRKTAARAKPVAVPPEKTSAVEWAATRQAKTQTRPSEAPVRGRRKAKKPAKRKHPTSGAERKRAPQAPRRAGKAVLQSKRPAFREVLEHSVLAEKPQVWQERRQRVSVRLSRAEERRLQQRASRAGVTISEYLRRSALDPEQQRLEPGHAGASQSRVRHGRPATAAPLFASSTNQNSSMLGGWIALLRNRFLASPPRFAARA